MSERMQAINEATKEIMPEIESLETRESELCMELEAIRSAVRELRIQLDRKIEEIEQYFDALDIIERTPDEVKRLGSKDLQP